MRIGLAAKLTRGSGEREILAFRSSPLITFHTTSLSPYGVERAISPAAQHIQHVAIEYFRRSDGPMGGSPDCIIAEPFRSGWMAFADLISHFPWLHSVVFAFTSEEDAKTFLAKNKPVIRRLREFTTPELIWIPSSTLKLANEHFYSRTSSLNVLVRFFPLNHVRDFASVP